MQEHERQDTGSQQDVSESVSMHSPGDSEASSVAQSAKSGRGSLLREEPAMISFEDEMPPMPRSRSTAGQRSKSRVCFSSRALVQAVVCWNQCPIPSRWSVLFSADGVPCKPSCACDICILHA